MVELWLGWGFDNKANSAQLGLAGAWAELGKNLGLGRGVR